MVRRSRILRLMRVCLRAVEITKVNWCYVSPYKPTTICQLFVLLRFTKNSTDLMLWLSSKAVLTDFVQSWRNTRFGRGVYRQNIGGQCSPQNRGAEWRPPKARQSLSCLRFSSLLLSPLASLRSVVSFNASSYRCKKELLFAPIWQRIEFVKQCFMSHLGTRPRFGGGQLPLPAPTYNSPCVSVVTVVTRSQSRKTSLDIFYCLTLL